MPSRCGPERRRNSSEAEAMSPSLSLLTGHACASARVGEACAQQLNHWLAATSFPRRPRMVSIIRLEYTSPLDSVISIMLFHNAKISV